MKTYATITQNGARLWEADDADHAREQHEDAFKDDDTERILKVERYLGFKEGDRVHGGNYVNDWGTVIKVSTPVREILSQGEPTGHYDQWYEVRFDNKGTYEMNDGGTHPMGWEWGRIVPPHIAKRYGYGDDPRG